MELSLELTRTKSSSLTEEYLKETKAKIQLMSSFHEPQHLQAEHFSNSKDQFPISKH